VALNTGFINFGKTPKQLKKFVAVPLVLVYTTTYKEMSQRG